MEHSGNVAQLITNVISIITNVIALHRSITFVNHFADRLRRARKLRGLSQAALAKACGLSQGAIANYESKSRKTAKEIFRLAEALQVRPAWLAMGTGPMDAASEEPAPRSAYTVSDAVPLEGPALWPFEKVRLDDFLALASDERAVIENTLATLIGSLRDKHTDP